ncbi:AAA family ATPase [Mucilaginibacter sp. AK015]|uniref:AAA family ATPase n=1 Tax=Mucilaginibacter sp. AK015 TaxID=2723072 RepID=UPI00161CA813|nr:AAA family ATPase [Mucilaginibacter sp. AK015]
MTKTNSMHIHADDLQRDTMLQFNQPQQTTDSVLMVRGANYWLQQASKAAVPKMLFGKFWHEGEVCILFADSNLGKSILAVQIADAISKGHGKYPFDVEAPAQPVIYCDFELTDKQFEARYSVDYANHYDFNTNFLRGRINSDIELPNGFDHFDDYLNHDLERTVVETGARILIIDNITYLRNETEQAKGALPLMKHLKSLKNKYDLSILVLAHTPKRDLTQPITRNDLGGSKMLMNFCDSAFTIGESSEDTGLRYLKQIKQRNTEQLYGDSNVCLCLIDKPHNFLQYQFIAFSQEWKQLARKRSDKAQNPHLAKVLELKALNWSLREIGDELGISFQKVDRMIRAAANKAD